MVIHLWRISALVKPGLKTPQILFSAKPMYEDWLKMCSHWKVEEKMCLFSRISKTRLSTTISCPNIGGSLQKCLLRCSGPSMGFPPVAKINRSLQFSKADCNASKPVRPAGCCNKDPARLEVCRVSTRKDCEKWVRCKGSCFMLLQQVFWPLSLSLSFVWFLSWIFFLAFSSCHSFLPFSSLPCVVKLNKKFSRDQKRHLRWSKWNWGLQRNSETHFSWWGCLL